MKTFLLFAFLAILPACAAAVEGGPQRIGVAGAVSGLVRATAPGTTEGRVIRSGAPLFLNDHVVTDAEGKLQVMLMDETVFTLGPKSDMLLDEFVYDPSSDAGKVSMKVTKGVFRFVTGKVARKDPANMKVKLSVGTIGIRGTMVAGRTDEQGSTVILLGPGSQNNADEAPGAIIVDNGNSSVFIDQPGFGVTLVPGQAGLLATDMSQQVGQLTSDLSPGPSQGSDSGSGQPSGSGPEQSSGGTGGAGSSASEEAGQNMAAAGITLADASGVGGMTQSLGDTSNQAMLETLSNDAPVSQLAIPDGVSTWDNVRTIPTGLVSYSGSGMCALVGTAFGDYPMDFALLVDFGNRTYGGGPSSLSISGIDSTSISQNGFDSLAGDARITLLYAEVGGNSSNPYFDNTQITFNNSGGVPAVNATVNVNYNGGLNSGTGQLTANPGLPPN